MWRVKNTLAEPVLFWVESCAIVFKYEPDSLDIVKYALIE